MTCQNELNTLLPTNKITESDFLRALKSLLPTGYLWGFKILPLSINEVTQNVIAPGAAEVQDNINTGSFNVWQNTIALTASNSIASTFFGLILSAFANELNRFNIRWNDLYRESIPGISIELLPDWEQEAGINEKCGFDLTTLSIEERQCNVQAIIYSDYSNSMNKQFFIDYAESIGYIITINDNSDLSKPFLVAPVGPSPDDLGSRVGDRLNDSGQVSTIVVNILSGNLDPDAIERFECNLNSVKSSHIIFVYVIGA